MEKFIIGRKYGNGQNFYEVLSIQDGYMKLAKKGEIYGGYLREEDGIQVCDMDEKKTPLKASSLMGKASHKKLLTEEEKEERRKEARKRWNEQNYDNLNIFLPHGMMKRIAEATKEQGFPSQRQFIIHALESAMKISS